jgi:hypothetical protein
MIQNSDPQLAQDITHFSMPEYRRFVKKYQEILNQRSRQTKSAPGGLKRRDELEDTLRQMEEEYLAWLPAYLLACCPFCGSEVRESIDTYSLNGLVTNGWCGTPGTEGLGWWKNTRYQTECKHVRIVIHCVSLNDLIPDDVFCNVELGPAVPYVMQEPLRAPDSVVVVHSLPVSRFDDDKPQHRYTAYFMTYFVKSEQAFYGAIQEWLHHRGLVRYDKYLDFDLRPYIEQGQLYWLDPDDPDLPLRNRPVEACPYLDLPGSQNPWRQIRGWGPWPALRRVLGWWQRFKLK